MKPFLYELALERRYLTNASLLDDSPINLDTATGVYLPQNYDRDFKGLVSVRTALGSSLNVPAVRTLVLVGVEAFRDRLHALGYADISEDGEFYGYSLALGSAEVSLWEQVARVSNARARRARSAAAAARRRSCSRRHARMLAADATFLVTDILSDRAARVATFGLDNNLNTAFWSAAKTGTSKDMRDNWCIGYTDRYTVGVWVGNFEGDSMRDVSGVTGAAPAWHDIMVALHARQRSRAPARAGRRNAAVRSRSSRRWNRRGANGSVAGTELSIVTAVPERAERKPHRRARQRPDHRDRPGHTRRSSARADCARAAQRRSWRSEWTAPRSAPPIRKLLWPPSTGAHRLALVDASGAVVDQVLFTVR